MTAEHSVTTEESITAEEPVTLGEPEIAVEPVTTEEPIAAEEPVHTSAVVPKSEPLTLAGNLRVSKMEVIGVASSDTREPLTHDKPFNLLLTLDL